LKQNRESATAPGSWHGDVPVSAPNSTGNFDSFTALPAA
jgi:hypothetical protein